MHHLYQVQHFKFSNVLFFFNVFVYWAWLNVVNPAIIILEV